MAISTVRVSVTTMERASMAHLVSSGRMGGLEMCARFSAHSCPRNGRRWMKRLDQHDIRPLHNVGGIGSQLFVHFCYSLSLVKRKEIVAQVGYHLKLWALLHLHNLRR